MASILKHEINPILKPPILAYFISLDGNTLGPVSIQDALPIMKMAKPPKLPAMKLDDLELSTDHAGPSYTEYTLKNVIDGLHETVAVYMEKVSPKTAYEKWPNGWDNEPHQPPLAPNLEKYSKFLEGKYKYNTNTIASSNPWDKSKFDEIQKFFKDTLDTLTYGSEEPLKLTEVGGKLIVYNGSEKVAEYDAGTWTETEVV